MLPRTRQRFKNRLLMISLGLGLLTCQSTFGQESDPNVSKPNALRPRTSNELTTPVENSAIVDDKAPPPLSGLSGFLPAVEADRNAISEASAFDDSEILLIGSASTLMASNEEEVNSNSEALGEFEDIDLSIALQLAASSMSHVSPIFFWMAESSSAFARTATTEPDRSRLSESSTTANDMDSRTAIIFPSTRSNVERPVRPIVLPPDPVEMLETARNEPPRMLTREQDPAGQFAASSGFENSDESSTHSTRLTQRAPTLQKEFENADTKSESQSDSSPTDSVTRKPAPRKVRLPFETTEPEPIAPNHKATPNSIDRPSEARVPINNRMESDSQREQEEPQLDPGIRSNDREHQGVDALSASKPRSNRREIRVDEVSSKREVPSTAKQSMDPATSLRMQRADQCFSHYLKFPESTSVRSPWAVMHAVLAYGGEYEMVHGNGRVNAIGWMCHNGTCRTQRMFSPKGKGFVPNVGGGVQGHEGQFLAILAQCNVPLDYPIQIGTSKYKVEDLVRYEMATCKEKSELTFKLIGLSYYLDSNKQWKANDGKVWSIPKLIQEEMAQPIIGSACGGTHRLMGFSFSVRQRQLQSQPVNGQYARAAKFVRDYVTYTLQLQNPDGSFSTNWYEGRGNEPNEERKVQTSGHMLEWLLFTMTDEEVKSPRVAKGIDFLLSKIYDKRDYKWPIGPRGHATRAVTLYRDRMQEIQQSSSIVVPVKTAVKAPSSPAPIVRR